MSWLLDALFSYTGYGGSPPAIHGQGMPGMHRPALNQNPMGLFDFGRGHPQNNPVPFFNPQSITGMNPDMDRLLQETMQMMMELVEPASGPEAHTQLRPITAHQKEHLHQIAGYSPEDVREGLREGLRESGQQLSEEELAEVAESYEGVWDLLVLMHMMDQGRQGPGKLQETFRLPPQQRTRQVSRYASSPDFAYKTDVTPAVSRGSIQEKVVEAAKRHGINPALALAQANQESGFRASARSHKGAAGVMQVMPGTMGDLEKRYAHLRNMNGVDKNIEAGMLYMKEQLKRFNGNVTLALAAYNAGPGNAANGKWRGYSETRNYVASIQKNISRFEGRANA